MDVFSIRTEIGRMLELRQEGDVIQTIRYLGRYTRQFDGDGIMGVFQDSNTSLNIRSVLFNILPLSYDTKISSLLPGSRGQISPLSIPSSYLRVKIRSVIPLYDCVFNNFNLISCSAFPKRRIPEPNSVGTIVM